MKEITDKTGKLVAVLLSVAIYLITFPNFYPVYGPGLDPSYIWAINYLFNFNYEALTSLIYPIGPLGFLKYAAAYENNLIYYFLFFSVVKTTFLFFFFRLGFLHKGRITVLHFLIALFVGYFSGLDFSMIGLVVVLLLLFIREPRKIFYFILANLLAATGLFIKSSIGLASYSSIFVFFVVGLVNSGYSRKNLLYHSAISICVFLFMGIVVFQGASSFLNFLVGTAHLAGAYSSGLALYPDNNWWLLGGFILSMIAIPFVFKGEDIRRTFSLLILPLFAMWKHAIGREDIYHAQSLIGFLVVFWGILLINTKRIKVWFFLLPTISILLFAFNLRNLPMYSPYPINLNGITNFNESILHFDQFNEKHKTISARNLAENKLDQNLLNLIGDRSIDVYPWDLSYIPANNLNWEPRKTLELGASTSQWLSNESAKHFNGDDAPEFVIIHFKDDKWGGRFASIDGRYLLNDEPLLVYNLLDNYKVKVREQDFLLLEKMKESNMMVEEIDQHIKTGWNKWISVPENNSGISRVRFENKSTLLGKLKSFLYKGEGFFIDYRLEDGNVITYRFLASNAQDGLWVDPLLLDPADENSISRVNAIRFHCTNEKMVKEEISLRWEVLKQKSGQPIEVWFNENNGIEKSFKTILNQAVIDNNNINPISLSSRSFSGSFRVKLDTLWTEQIDQIKVEADLLFQFENVDATNIMLVISLQDSQNNFWISRPLVKGENSDEWSYLYLKETLDKRKHPTGELSVYVWNNGKDTVLLKDFRVKLKSK